MANLPNSGQSNSMDSLTVTREEFRLDKGNELEFLAQALGNVSGSYTTEIVSPTAVVLQGTPTLAAGAEPTSTTNSLRLSNTRWTRRYANSPGTTAPTSPVDGQTWIDLSLDPPVLKIWDATNTVWVETSGGGASVTISDTAPVSPNAGDLWWDSVAGNLYVWYADANSNQWVQTNGGGGGGSGGATGGGNDQIFYENDQTVTTDYTLTNNKNAMSAGPVSIGAGVTVTVPSGSNWVIV